MGASTSTGGHLNAQLLSSTSGESRANQESCWPEGRLMLFLALHLIFFFVQLGLLRLFCVRGSVIFSLTLFAIMLFSTVVYSHVSWHCEAEHFSERVTKCVPLKYVEWKRRVLLWLLLALFPGVVVVLALEDYFAQREQRSHPDTRSGMAWMVDPKHTLTCKPLVSVFEGILTAWVALYAYGSSQYHLEDYTEDAHEDGILVFAAVLALFVAGTALVESDICLTIAVNIAAWRRALHVVFRSCEVLSRMAYHFYFLARLWPIRVPCGAVLLLDVLFTVCVVHYKGGCEAHWLWRFLCGIPCVSTDLFFFIISMPTKRKAARDLSNIFFVRHVLCLFALVAHSVTMASDDKADEFGKHFYGGLAVLSVLYIVLWLWWNSELRAQAKFEYDIFQLVREGDTPRVMKICDDPQFDVNQMSVDGETLLMVAVDNPNHALDVCARLIDARARVDISPHDDICMFVSSRPEKMKERWTVLHTVAAREQSLDTELLRILLNAWHLQGTRCDASLLQNIKGRTPLHEAVKRNRVEAARILVQKIPGLIYVRDCDGKLPWDYASSEDKEMKTLTEPDSDEERRQTCGRSASIQDQSYREAGTLSDGLCSTLLRVSGGMHSKMFPLPSAMPNAGDTPDRRQRNEAQRIEITNLVPVRKRDGEPMGDDGTWRAIRNRGDYESALLGRAQEHLSRKKRGRCEDEAIVDSGEYGVVMRVKENGTNKDWALKVVLDHPTDERYKQLAMREVRIYRKIAAMPHDYCMGSRGDFTLRRPGISGIAIVLEFAPNGNLLDALYKALDSSTSTYRTPESCKRWVGEIFQGLEHLHLRIRILMRDLKPSNVVLDAANRCRIIDFGISKEGSESRPHDSTHPCPGTHWYMAPEIHREQEYSWPCDIYSLGVMTLVMFSGGSKRNHLLEIKDPDPCSKLRQVLEEPLSPIDEPVYNFVSNTTQLNQIERWQHERIKTTAFMKECIRRASDYRPGANLA